MTKERKVPVTPADSYPLGHAKENKDASAYTGFKYPSGGGNDIGIYKQPMPNPASLDIEVSQDPNKLKSQDLNFKTARQRVSAGDPGSKGGKKNIDMKTMGRNLAKIAAQKRG